MLSILVAVLAAAPVQGANPITPAAAPPENPVTAEKAVLGKILFWEEQLSSDDTMACGTCHIASAGFTDPRVTAHPGFDQVPGTPDDIFTSPGIVRQDANEDFVPDPLFRLRRQLTPRRTPDVFSAQYVAEAFWDGRGSDTFTDPVTGLVEIQTGGALESQITGPPTSNREMAHETRDWTAVVDKIRDARPLALATDIPSDMAAAVASYPDYPALFQWAFGTPDVTAKRIAFAIATYERTLVPDQAPWALWTAGNPTAMTPAQVDGWNQFNGIADCATCHPPPTFTNGDFHNIGLRPIAEDAGRMDVTGNFADRGKFKTPSLLNVGLRPRFWHNGQDRELITMGPPPGPGQPPVIGGVAGVYMAGGGPNLDNRDPLLIALRNVPGLNIHHLMDFVENALTDPRVAAETYPFDRPTLRSERVPFDSNFYGDATPGRPGLPPLRLLAHVPARTGSDVFKIGLAGGPAGATVLLGASWYASNGSLRAGAEVWIGNLLQPLMPVLLLDDGNGVGYATVHAPLPANSNLMGRTLRVQAFLLDPLAPSGACATEAAAFEVL